MSKKQSVYIPSVEGAALYGHEKRGQNLKLEHVGMIPYSLELMKLHKMKLKTIPNKTSEKLMSNDLINVRFNQKVEGWGEVQKGVMRKIKDIEKEIRELNSKINDKQIGSKQKEKIQERIQNKKQYKRSLEEFKENEFSDPKRYPEWKEVKNKELREKLYDKGFTITDDKGKKTEYKMYKRSSSKSRKGECLFIKKSLYSKMIKWSRMELPFHKNFNVDLASLMAYESLVGSSIEKTLNIDPNKILIVDDVESTFNWKANVVQKGKNGFLDCILDENAEITNSLFDGQSLLHSKFFKVDEHMLQLRNHMFKTASFSTNITDFMEANCPEDTSFDEWEIKNMFNQPIKAKDVDMITTPSSAKFLKFSHLFSGGNKERQMWDYWRQFVETEGNVFGVCKSESKTSRGTNDDGQFVQQTSYQMINSMQLTEEDVEKLSEFDVKYIRNLSNDDEYIEHLYKGINEVNMNEMLIDLYRHNSDFVQTKMFRDFRKAEKNRFKNHIKRGKLRIPGDYCVLIGNCYEMLLHSIRKFDIHNIKEDQQPLKGNQIHTELFPFGKEYVGFRNPHTSPSNVLITDNVKSDKIDKYFNLGSNVVAINVIGFPVLDILSGADQDGDVVCLFDSEILLQRAKEMDGKYPVSINNVKSQKKNYKLNMLDKSEIDHVLGESTDNIGTVVNLAQEILSLYWDGKTNGEDDEVLEELLKKTEIFTILSEISIDMAKKLYDLNIGDEIEYMEETTDLKPLKPLFFKTVKQSKTIKDRVTAYKTSMDYLHNILDNIERSEPLDNIDIMKLMNTYPKRNVNKKQHNDILDRVGKMVRQVNSIKAKKYSNETEQFEAMDNVVKYCQFYIEKKKINEDTMYYIIKNVLNNKSKIASKMMNMLYTTHRETFLSIFTEKSSQK
ncbi:hypothetical protein [Halobacillus sp. Marseille-P3879]|uniref:hypothetical protein n=1 Tax=Halobacillus sp. Marseille-P3879 TaxID=2045014 RepID=UPI000C7D4089|nr:hypothetical protein [Halobacillus sp. Marseille-P3879]